MAKIPFSLPALSPEAGLAQYLQEIAKFPYLTDIEEHQLAVRWAEDQDVESAHKLVTSHLRLVAKIAMGYRGYGLPLMELISEGNIGLMQAVKRFRPELGFRLATYAIWWIKAAIQEYVLHSWSLVKIGTTAAQKKLFFNLRKVKHRIEAFDDRSLSPAQVRQIAQELNVEESDVIDMDSRLSQSDQSLNAPLFGDDEAAEHIDFLASPEASQETVLVRADEYAHKKALFIEAMKELNERERDIIVARRLSDSPKTLEDLSEEYGISRERVRQIEARAMEKLKKGVESRESSKSPRHHSTLDSRLF